MQDVFFQQFDPLVNIHLINFFWAEVRQTAAG